MRAMQTCCVLAALAVALAGCEDYSRALAPAKPLTPAQTNFQAVWQTTLDVLQTHRFEIDRQDRRAGVITTKPMLGQHFMEFWRDDAVTPADLAESTFQTIFRTVTVKIEPTAQGAITYKAKVEVSLQRSSREELGVISTTDAYDMFILPGREEKDADKLLYGPTERKPESGKPIPTTKIDLGKYKSLASKLAAEIQRKAVQRPS